MKKSLGQIIGEIIAGLRLGKQLSIEQELAAAEGWEKVTAENRANTISFINRVINSIPIAETNQTKIMQDVAAAEGVTNIVSNFISDYKKGFNNVIPDSFEDEPEEVEEELPEPSVQAQGGGAAFGPNIGSPITPQVQALSAEAIESTLRNAVNMGQIPGATISSSGTVQPLTGPLSEENIIMDLIAVAPDIKFLGLQSRGYPLGYSERQAPDSGYGNFPVYLPDMEQSFFGAAGLSESYIGDLQDKLLRAGYLRSSFSPEQFDEATAAAVQEAMAVHNVEGRVPNIPEVAGSLLDFLGLGTEETKYAWDDVRNREVRDFFFNELDKDVATAEDRKYSDVLTEIPTFSDETAGYLILNTLQQYFPGGQVTLDNIKNATTLINKVAANVAQDVSKMQKDAEAASIASGQAAITAAAEVRKLRERNPNLSDDELKLMYPELFNQTVEVSGELGAFGAGAAERQSILFQQKIGTAVQNLIQPELDFITKQRQFDRATGNLLAANRGLAAIEQGAPT